MMGAFGEGSVAPLKLSACVSGMMGEAASQAKR